MYGKVSVLIQLIVLLYCCCSLDCLSREPLKGGLSATGLVPLHGIENSGFAYVGAQITFNCTLDQTVNRDARDLVLSLVNDTSAANCTLINYSSYGRTLIAEVNVTGQREAGEYFCWLRGSHSSQWELIGSWEIFFQYDLRSVSNLLCSVYDWDQSLTCSWDYGIRYVNNTGPGNLPGIEVEAYISTGKSKDPCPYVLSPYDESSLCVWSGENFRAADRYLVVVILSSNITQTRVVTTPLPVITIDHVKPSPVINLNVEQTNSSCLTLAWSHHREHRDKVFRVNVSTGTVKILNESHTIECGLKPFSEYIFYVETCALNDNEKAGYWSEPVNTSAITDQAAPSSSFLVKNGSYVLHDCADGKRNVTIFWKHVPQSERNGEIIGYQLLYNECILDESDKMDPLSAVLQDTVCGADTSVIIYSKTNAGLSTSYSNILIQDCVTYIPDLAVQVLFGSLRAVWNSSESRHSSCGLYTNSSLHWDTVTFFWCLRDPSYSGHLCKEEIHWKNVPFTSDNFSILLLPEHRDNPYGFIVGISYQEQAIQWADCFFETQAQVNIVQDVQVYPRENKLVVRWTPQQCSRSYPVHILGYIILQKTQNSGIVNEEFVRGWRSFTLEVLAEQGVEYSITVQVVSYQHQRGPLSQPVIGLLPLQYMFPVHGYIAVVFGLLLIIGCIVGGRSKLIIYHKSKKKFSDFDYQSDFWPMHGGTCELPVHDETCGELPVHNGTCDGLPMHDGTCGELPVHDRTCGELPLHDGICDGLPMHDGTCDELSKWRDTARCTLQNSGPVSTDAESTSSSIDDNHELVLPQHRYCEKCENTESQGEIPATMIKANGYVSRV